MASVCGGVRFPLCLFCLALLAVPPGFSDHYDETEGSGLFINSDPRGARVFIDGIERGATPFSLKSLQPGEYQIRLVKEGYVERSFRTKVRRNSRMEITLDLEEARGQALISIRRDPSAPRSLPLEPRLYAGGVPVPAGKIPPEDVFSGTYEIPLSMPAGWRTLSAESFGWERISKTVYITEDRIERVELILSAAAFTLSGGKLKKGSVNPRNGGTLGNAEISFEVSGPGGGLLEVLDEGGNTIHTRPLGPFTVRQQRVLWNGKDSGGNPLPDGGYTIRISAWNDEGNTRPLELAARINSLLAMRPLGAASSSGGLFLASAPEALPALSYQIEGSLLGGKPPAEEAWKTLPFAVGFRLAILDTLEAAAAFNAVPAVSGGEAQVLWGAGASVKWILLPPGRGDPSLAAAAELSYAWAGEGPYTAFGMGTGAALRLPLAYRVLESRREGPVLDMILTPFILWAGEEGFPSSPVPRIGLGGGILFSWKQFAGGISLRWDYAPGAAQASGPLVSALELKFLPSSLILSLLAGAWRGEEGAGFFFGTGLGVMY